METKLTLPEEFLDRMKELLQDECEEFVASYDRPRSYCSHIDLLQPVHTLDKSSVSTLPTLL